MINRSLKSIRQFHSLTQVELAKKLGISKSYLSEIESGKKTISYDLLESYSKVFEIPVSSLVFLSEHTEENTNNKVSEQFRNAVAKKILDIMDWIALRNEAKKLEGENRH